MFGWECVDAAHEQAITWKVGTTPWKQRAWNASGTYVSKSWWELYALRKRCISGNVYEKSMMVSDRPVMHDGWRCGRRINLKMELWQVRHICQAHLNWKNAMNRKLNVKAGQKTTRLAFIYTLLEECLSLIHNKDVDLNRLPIIMLKQQTVMCNVLRNACTSIVLFCTRS